MIIIIKGILNRNVEGLSALQRHINKSQRFFRWLFAVIVLLLCFLPHLRLLLLREECLFLFLLR